MRTARASPPGSGPRPRGPDGGGPPAPPPASVEGAVPAAGLALATLGAALAGSLAVVLWAGVHRPALLPALAAVPVGLVAYVALVREPLLHLCAVLVGFVLVFNYSEGIQLSELAFGGYYVAYLAGWFALRPRGGRPLVESRVDAALVLFLAYVTLSLVLVPLRGGDLFVALNQWRVLLILLFYFPIRDAVADDPRALRWVAGAVLVVGLYVVGRNFARYLEGLQSAEALWELLLTRARNGERLVAVGLLGSVAVAVRAARTWGGRALLVGLIGVQTVSILLGQSRTMWVAISAGLVVILFSFGARRGALLLGALLAASALAYAVAVAVVGDTVALVVGQFASRALSIGQATGDVSVINRFYEWETALAAAAESPLFGYGLGVPYRFYSLIYSATEAKLFAHNTLITQLYRHGLVGVSLLGVVALGSLATAVRTAARLRHAADPLPFALVVTGIASLVLLGLGSLTESLFTVADGAYLVAVVLGVLAGLSVRARPVAPRGGGA